MNRVVALRRMKLGIFHTYHAGMQAFQCVKLSVVRLLETVAGIGLEALLTVNFLGHEIYHASVRAIQCIKLVVVRLFETALRGLTRFWTLWTGGLASSAVFYVVGILLAALLGVVLVGIVEFYRSTPSPSILAGGTSLLRSFSISYAIIIVVCTVSLWVILKFVASSTLVVLVFTRNWATRALDYVIRLLASIPTLILGNGILFLASAIGFQPHSTIAIALFILSALTLIGLPTVLQVGKEAFSDYDRRQLQQAAALGINRIVIGNKIALPTLRRTFNAAVTIAMTRIVIEGYVVVHRTLVAPPAPLAFPGEPSDLLHIFYGVYSTITIQSNVGLILVLFAIAILVNISLFNVIAGSKP
jgi:ABC-type phosphate transport system permease subunit